MLFRAPVVLVRQHNINVAFQQNFGGAPRKMFQGNWPCSKCGKAITELPFEPDPARLGQILCRDCHRAKREERGY